MASSVKRQRVDADVESDPLEGSSDLLDLLEPSGNNENGEGGDWLGELSPGIRLNEGGAAPAAELVLEGQAGDEMLGAANGTGLGVGGRC